MYTPQGGNFNTLGNHIILFQNLVDYFWVKICELLRLGMIHKKGWETLLNLKEAKFSLSTIILKPKKEMNLQVLA